jgi:internalin A
MTIRIAKSGGRGNESQKTPLEIAETRIEEARDSKAPNLDLKGLELTEIPDSIGQLTQLRRLNLENNQLTCLPENILQLKELVSLDLGRNKLSYLPESIGELSKLKFIALGENQLKKLPENIANLALLESLYLFSNQIEVFPEGFGKLTQLKSLFVGGNCLKKLPECIRLLSNLRELRVWHNLLIALPDWLGELTELQDLSFASNSISVLPERLQRLHWLKRIDFSHNPLTHFPEEISLFPHLCSLEAGQCGLTSLPNCLKQLTTLQYLDIQNNEIESIPEWIGELNLLEVLDVSNNKLTSLPESLSGLSVIKELYLQDNPGLAMPPEVLGPNHIAVKNNTNPAIPANPTRILDYYFSTRGSGASSRPLNEAKMILVGRGGAGKTSLINRLVHDRYNPSEVKTDGIVITPWQIQIRTDEVRLNIWDFGGQEIMHSTHQFFLTKRSLYLLVVNAREGEQDANIEYWLQLIESFGGDSPVLVVINKIKDHNFDLNRRGLQTKFPCIRGFFPTDCESGFGLEEITQAIQRETDRLEHLRDLFPANWFKIKNILDDLPNSEKQNFIPFTRYQQICSENGVDVGTSQETLVSFLHDLGTVINFRDNPRLSETQVLDPEWMTNGIYKILNADVLADKQGELRLVELVDILDPKEYPHVMHLYLLDLMRKFELCYEFYESAGHYLIPELLGKEEPNLNEFSAVDVLRFQYSYNIVPEGLLPRFIVRSRALNKNLPRWRSGVVLEWDGNRAIVTADVQDKRVSIAVIGPFAGRRRLLAVIRADMEHIHRSIVKLLAMQQVPVPGHPGLVVSYKKLQTFEVKGVTQFFEEYREDVVTLDVADLLNGVEEPSDKARGPMREEAGKGAIRIAFSYSHKDEELRDTLETHLKLLQRQDVISTWHDRKIKAGDTWVGVIDEEFQRADLILLLVSADFLASDYCYEIEIQTALAREAKGEAKVVPVILRACDWADSPFGTLQGLPKDVKPVTSWPNQDEAWTDIAKGIKKVVMEFRTREQGVVL